MKHLKEFKQINEIYSDEDFKRGEDDAFLEINFKGDIRRRNLAVKKLVRLKSQLPSKFGKSIDDIIDLIDREK